MLEDVRLQAAVSQTSSKTETPILEYLESPINQEPVFSDVEVPPHTLRQMDSDVITQDLMDKAAEGLRSASRYALRCPQRSRGRPKQTQKAQKVNKQRQSGSRTGCSDDASGTAEFCDCPTDSEQRDDVPTGCRSTSKVQYSINPKAYQDAKWVQSEYESPTPLRLSDIVQALPKTMLIKCRTRYSSCRTRTLGLQKIKLRLRFLGLEFIHLFH